MPDVDPTVARREWWGGNVVGAREAYESAEALADILAADYFEPGAPDLIEVPARATCTEAVADVPIRHREVARL